MTTIELTPYLFITMSLAICAAIVWSNSRTR